MSALHSFDLALCEYVRQNFCACLSGQIMRARLSRLSPSFQAYLLDPREAGSTFASGLRFLLNDCELKALEHIAHLEYSGTDWKPFNSLHRDATRCTAEIRDQLSAVDAQSWAEIAAGFIDKLENSHLGIGDGIGVMRDWFWELRFFKEAAEGTDRLPAPDGSFPTPTNPEPPPVKEWPSKEDDIRRMKSAITESEFGRDTNPDLLIKLAKIKKQRGRNALRELERRGEYAGFTRERAQRYKRPSES